MGVLHAAIGVPKKAVKVVTKLVTIPLALLIGKAEPVSRCEVDHLVYVLTRIRERERERENVVSFFT